MNEAVFHEAKQLFIDALLCSGMDEHCLKITFDSELVDEAGVYSFLLSVQIAPYQTDEGPCNPKPVIFQVDKVDGEEPCFIVGEDTETSIRYGNVFAYMYFSTLEIEAELTAPETTI